MELHLLRRDLRTIERHLSRGPRNPEVDTMCCGVSLAQCHALLAIDEKGSRHARLAKALEIEASTLTRTLDGLARLGFIERTTPQADRRSVEIRLTSIGRAKVEEVDRAWNSWLGCTLAALPAEERGPAVRGIAALAAAIRSRPCCASTAPSRSAGEIH